MDIKKVPKVPKVPKNFSCICCDYISARKSQYERHLLTTKHIKMVNDNNDDSNDSNMVLEGSKKYGCDCGKVYTNRNNLCRHKKTCKNKKSINNDLVTAINNSENASKLTVDSSFIMEMCKENQEIKNLLIEQMKENKDLMNKMVEITQNSLTVPKTINNNNNTTNNQFNLNLFLNENCKNAVNFSDFINNIQVTDDDLENNAKMGFVEGVTKIIMDNLRQLDLTNRPIHCTDVKRETIYVKEEEQWDKDNSTKVIQKGIQNITCKNMQQLCQWREENPSYADDMDSVLGEKSIIMQQNSIAGPKRDDYYPKIIKNIAKETVISNKNGLIKK